MAETAMTQVRLELTFHGRDARATSRKLHKMKPQMNTETTV